MKCKMMFIIIIPLTMITSSWAQDGASTLNGITTHGFISQGYMKSSVNNYQGNTEDGTFEFNELGINFSTEMTDELRVGMQLFARDLGNLDNDKIVIDWAYGDYHLFDWLGVRAGKMKMPLGQYNEIRDIDMLRTNILMPQGVYNESWRSTFNAIKGIGIYGFVTAGPLGTFNYQAQSGVLNITDDSGLNKYIEDQLNANFDSYSLSSTNILNLNWDTPLPNLKLGASMFNMSGLSIYGNTLNNSSWRNNTVAAAGDLAAGIGMPDPTSYDEAMALFAMTGIDLNMVDRPIVQSIDNVNAYWLSGEFSWSALTLAGEYFNMKTDLSTVSPGFGAALDPNLENLPGPSDNELGGFYGMVGYNITDNLAGSVYYTEYDNDFNDDADATKDIAFSVKYDVSTYWTIKAETHLMDGQYFLYKADQKDPSNMENKWNLFAAKLTYNF
jgi:hypothetical protein